MIITGLIVTYGDRFHLLESVINALKRENLNKIIVILNGVEINSKHRIEDLEKREPILHTLDLNKNTGSAGGFKNGIMKAIELETDFIWLLDDDNCPEKNALSSLLNFMKSKKFSIEKDALLSFRLDRPLYLESVKQGNGSGMLKGINSALGFSLFSNNKQSSNYSTCGLKVAPYGGLFFHKNLINTIGLPDETYFLYGDDFDFSIRISKNKGKISLVENSIIKDIEKSFHLREKGIFQTRFHQTGNAQLITYSVKNGIVFELNHQVKSQLKYSINLFVYTLFVVFLLAISFDFKKVNYFLKGVYSGIKKGLKS